MKVNAYYQLYCKSLVLVIKYAIGHLCSLLVEHKVVEVEVMNPSSHSLKNKDRYTSLSHCFSVHNFMPNHIPSYGHRHGYIPSYGQTHG